MACEVTTWIVWTDGPGAGWEDCDAGLEDPEDPVGDEDPPGGGLLWD